MSAPGAAATMSQLSLFDDAPHTAVPAAGEPRPPSNGAPGGASIAPSAAPSTAPVAAPGAAPLSFIHPRARRDVALEGHRVAYELRRGRRRTIGFVVGAEGLTVSAPRWVTLADIDEALRSKGRWIVRKLQEQQDRSRRLAASRIEWRDGATLPFLGQPVVVVLDPRVDGVMLDAPAEALPGVAGRLLRVGLPHDAAPTQVRDAVQSWLQRQARRIFEERCQAFAPRLRVRVRRLSLSSATTRWGSASADGSIRLNWRLVHFALPTIDYVVAHELAHLREMNHSAAFWDVVRSVLPDYEVVRATLKDEALPVLDSEAG